MVSEQQKLTPWFVNGEKPVRKGVYNVSCQRRHQSGTWFAYWDGKRFLPFDADKNGAEQSGREFLRKFKGCGAGAFVLSGGSWRGIAANTKGK